MAAIVAAVTCGRVVCARTGFGNVAALMELMHF
jgi:hypothetical protein